LFQRLVRGLNQSLGLALLGLVIAAVGYLVVSPSRPVSTSTRVIFAFDGFDRGEYPDHSKFQADDLRAPEIITAALKKLNLEATDAFQSEIRGALAIDGIIPPEVVKQRDRLRSAGQNPPAYNPDEYKVTLTLPRKFPLSGQQRVQVLREIISVYQEKFQRTYARLPVAFGNVQPALQDADLPDYESILNAELTNVTAYLNQQAEKAKSFRSPATNLSFSDLLKQTQLFSEVQLVDVLSIIRMHNLSRSKDTVLTKMDYSLRRLRDEERLAIEEEKVIKEYLAKAEERAQSYVVGIKSQVPQQRTDTLMLDQGLVDSLLVNDAYNFTMRKALDASLEVKRIQSNMSRIQERRKEFEGLGESLSEATAIKSADASLKVLMAAYDQLIANIRRTHADYVTQQFANAIRLSDQIYTAGGSVVRAMLIPCAAGFCLGLALGMGLSLLGVYVGAAKRS